MSRYIEINGDVDIAPETLYQDSVAMQEAREA